MPTDTLPRASRSNSSVGTQASFETALPGAFSGGHDGPAEMAVERTSLGHNESIRIPALAVGSSAREGSRQAAEHGYGLIRSAVLGGAHIVLVRDRHVRVPTELRGYGQYTLDEVRRLEGASADTVRETHRVKQIFSGEVLSGPGGGD